jgi:NNP family nitrate/nitrite transporter-like MFS transporter
MTDKTCPIPEPFSSVLGTIIFLTLIFFLSFISRFIFAPLMPIISDDLLITPSQAGSIFLFVSVGVAIGSLCSGFVSSKINHRGSLVVSIFGAGTILMVCVFLSNLWIIRLAMIFLGITAGLNLPSNLAVLTATVNRPDWGKAMAVQQTGPPISLILGPLLIALLLPWMSWRLILACLAVFIIGIGLVLILFGKFGDFPGDPPSASNVKLVLAKKSFWIMIALFALGISGHVGLYTMIPLYLVTEHNFGFELANTIVGLSQVSTLFMTFFSGWVTDRLHEKRAIFLFLLTAGVFTILLGVLSGTWLELIIFIQPAMAVCFFPAGFAALSRIVQPNIRSLATSWAAPIAFTIGGGLFPAALGYMGQAFSFRLGISLAGIIMMLGSSLVVFLDLLEEMEEGC